MFDLFPLKPRTKIPADKGWREATYTPEQLAEWRGNFGVRIRADEAVIDIDPRRDPHGRSADAILADLELEYGLDCSAARRVRTGGGGLHVYVSKPADQKFREKLGDPEWDAVEFKQIGKFVVAPGSIHPDTGLVYALEQEGEPVAAPTAFLSALATGPRESTATGETISSEHLRRLLDQIDVMQFHDAGREPWLKVLLEAHAATGGSEEGFEIFADWSSKDETFAADIDSWRYWWDQAHGDRPGDRTLASLIRRVTEAEGNPAAPPEDDFADLVLPPLPELTPVSAMSLTPFDPAELPERKWLIRNMLLDGTVALLIARGGAGKSLLALIVAVMVAAGREWAHWKAERSERVLLLNAEDDRTEMRRRLTVVARALGVELSELNGRLDVIARGEVPDFALVHRVQERGAPRRTEFWKQLRMTMREGKYGLLIADPLIELQTGLDENSNADMKELAGALRVLANDGPPVFAIHHAGKGAGGRGQDAARGGSSLVGAARTQLNLETMDPKEAQLLLAAHERHRFSRFVKLVGAKANYAGPSEGPQWLELVEDWVRNAPGGGDTAPYLRKWNPIVLKEELADETVDVVLREIYTCSDLGTGARYRHSNRGALQGRADAMAADKLGLTVKQAHSIIEQLVSEGRLVQRLHAAGKKGEQKDRLFLSDREAERIFQVSGLQEVPEDGNDDD